ncbi:MAG: aminotransferase class I/II-fold pyridoxal phosphate-dependent enzyme [Candidatus Neomarinimicrobiota bacterium]
MLTYSTKKAKLFSKLLLQQYNSYIQPIFYPTVPEGSARLRITVTPKHSIQDIDNLLAALKRLFDNEKLEQHINTATRQNQVA